MGVDRDTIAWVLYSDGELFRVDITNARVHRRPTGRSQQRPHSSSAWASRRTRRAAPTTRCSSPAAPRSARARRDAREARHQHDVTATTRRHRDRLARADRHRQRRAVGLVPATRANAARRADRQDDRRAVKTYTLPRSRGTPTRVGVRVLGRRLLGLPREETPTSSTTVYQIDGTTGAVKSTTARRRSRTIVGAGVSTCAPVVIQ